MNFEIAIGDGTNLSDDDRLPNEDATSHPVVAISPLGFWHYNTNIYTGMFPVGTPALRH